MKTVLSMLAMGVAVIGLQGCLVEVSGTHRSSASRCGGSECVKVPVKVAYLVQEHGSWDGENQVTIEARFEGEDFGEPVASTEIVTRSAQGSGEATLFLEPGDYCIRGYARRRVASESSCTFDSYGNDFVFSCDGGGERYESRSFVQCLSVEEEAVEREVQVDIEVAD